MPKFIELTSTQYKKGCLVNVDKITNITETPRGNVKISFSENLFIEVDETYKQVMEKIKEVQDE